MFVFLRDLFACVKHVKTAIKQIHNNNYNNKHFALYNFLFFFALEHNRVKGHAVQEIHCHCNSGQCTESWMD